jgi:hypothetical protein
MVRNPNFYPIPVNRVPTAALGIEDEIIHIKTDSLHWMSWLRRMASSVIYFTPTTLIERKYSSKNLRIYFPSGAKRLIRLLDNHIVRFPDNETFLYVGMKSIETGNVHFAFFQKISGKQADERAYVDTGSAHSP